MKNVFKYSSRNLSEFQMAIRDYGWVVFENALDKGFVDRINDDLSVAYVERRSIQIKNGISDNMEGTLHHLLDSSNFSLQFLKQMYCHAEIMQFLSGNYILNGMNAVTHSRLARPYLSHVHRDVRTFMANLRLLVQMIVTLDDFNLQNGATYFLTGSHKMGRRPNDGYFYENADRAIAPAGSIILFDSNIWHSAGENTTALPRRALTLGFTKPFIKQQMDYPRLLGYDFASSLDPDVLQVIGYNARVPESLEEYYQPVHLRMYQRDQG